MSGAQFRSPINIGLPLSPQGLPEELQDFGQNVFNSIRALQDAIGKATGIAYTDPTYSSQQNPGVLQTFLVPSSMRIKANVAVAAGRFVALTNIAGELQLVLADASGISTRAWGWAPFAIAAGDVGIVYFFEGYHPGFAALAFPATFYLSSTSPGGISAAVPVGSGKIIQEIGTSISATEILVRLSTPIVLP